MNIRVCTNVWTQITNLTHVAMAIKLYLSETGGCFWHSHACCLLVGHHTVCLPWTMCREECLECVQLTYVYV